MSKFKTITTDSTTHRIFNGQMRVCATDDKKNYKVKLMLLNEKVNENHWQYLRVAEHAHEAQDIPLLYSVINGKVGNSHDFEILTDERGHKYASFIGAESEHPYGWLPSVVDGKPNARMENIDGVEWLTSTAYLPSFYNTEMINELEKNGGQMPISIETLVSKSHYEGDVEVEEEYSIVGVTILGVTTKPAVKNANIRKLSVEGEALKELKLRVASLTDSFIEPQTQKQKNLEKGVTRTMAKVRNIDDLRSMFPEYTVLGVNGQNVALLDKQYRPCSYAFVENEMTVCPERIQRAAVNSIFGEGDKAVSVSAEQLVGDVVARYNATKTALDNATKENADLTAKINAMAEAEKKRRKKVVESAIKDKVKDAKRNAGCEIADDICDDMLTDAALNEFAEMEKNGEFVGDSVAVEKVSARLYNKVCEANKAKQEAKNNAIFSFENFARQEGKGEKPDSTPNEAIMNIVKD